MKIEIDERYLDLLQEECAELIVAIAKIKRFGLHDKWEGKTNKARLHEETGDVLAILIKLGILKIVDSENFTASIRIKESIKAKFEKLKTYGPDGSYLETRKAK